MRTIGFYFIFPVFKRKAVVRRQTSKQVGEDSKTATIMYKE